MSLFPYRKPWTKHPEQVVNVDWSNPLAKSLKHLYLATSGGIIDLVTGRPITNPASTQAVERTRLGTAADFDGAVLGYDALPTADNANDQTIGCIAKAEAVTADARLFALGYSSNAGTIHAIQVDPAGAANLHYYSRATSYSSTSGDGQITLSAGELFTASFYYDSSDQDLRVKENLNEAFSITGAGTGDRTYDRVAFGGLQRGTSSNQLDSSIILAWIFDKKLSGLEIAALHKNPWQLLQPRTQYIPYSIAGAAPTFNPAWARNSNQVIGVYQ